MAKINEYVAPQSHCYSLKPVKIVKRIIPPAPGAAGVPIDDIKAKMAIKAILAGVTS